jgi:hypothetical protein
MPDSPDQPVTENREAGASRLPLHVEISEMLAREIVVDRLINREIVAGRLID